MRNLVCAGISAAILIAAASQAFAQGCPSPAGFPRWLQGFKQEAAAQGISPQTLSALDGLTYDPATVAKDRAQGVFAQTFLQFSDRMVSNNRLQVGSALIKKNAATFAKIKQQFGVPAPVLVAYWGLGDRFRQGDGQPGDAPLARNLELSIAVGPRSSRGSSSMHCASSSAAISSPAEMRGPAHGEVGQFQFQPSIYYQYAVDFDGNGRRDMIRSAPDALASAANYLKGIGWQAGQPWIEEVVVPDADGLEPSRRHHQEAALLLGASRRHLSQRQGASRPTRRRPRCSCQWGGTVRPSSLIRISTSISNGTSRSSTRPRRPIYATRLAGAPALSRGRGVEPLPIAQAKQVQQLLAKRGYDVGKIDGVIGAATRNAIREMQVKYGLPADGYPTMELLAALQRRG